MIVAAIPTRTLRYVGTLNGHCRVYYRGERGDLYCFQEAGMWGRAIRFEFYVCSRDGEPSHKVSIAGRRLDRLPADDSITARRFVAWRGAP